MIRYDIPGHVMHKSPQLAIREGQYKLLLNPDQTRLELYDILADPREMNNLASQYPKVVAKMSEKLFDWKKTLPDSPVDESTGKNNYNWPGE